MLDMLCKLFVKNANERGSCVIAVFVYNMLCINLGLRLRFNQHLYLEQHYKILDGTFGGGNLKFLKF